MVLITKFGVAMEAEDPTMRNSNLFPVKAKGEVRLRSEVSMGSAGSVETPMRRWEAFPFVFTTPVSICSSASVSCSPR